LTKQDTTYILNFGICLNFSLFTVYQCAFFAPRSGSGIGDGKKSRSGIRDEYSGSYFLELCISFLGKKLEFFDVDPDPVFGILSTMDPGSGWKKVGS
jgi:hypothetical protein